jgi:hypothetical protein
MILKFSIAAKISWEIPNQTILVRFQISEGHLDKWYHLHDADITETYQLKKIDDNKFEITQSGIKTLEVIASFPDNEHLSYTMLVDVIGVGENNY